MSFFLVITVISSLCLSCFCDRLPQPLPDEDYKLLCKFLKDNVFVMKNKYTAQEKRIYRLFTSGHYKLQIKPDPITGEEETKLVSL